MCRSLLLEQKGLELVARLSDAAGPEGDRGSGSAIGVAYSDMCKEYASKEPNNRCAAFGEAASRTIKLARTLAKELADKKGESMRFLLHILTPFSRMGIMKSDSRFGGGLCVVA